MMMVVPHVVVAGRALVPMVLVVVGFQLLIHVKGSPRNAYVPNNDKIKGLGMITTMITVVFDVAGDDVDNTDTSDTSRNSNRIQPCTPSEGAIV